MPFSTGCTIIRSEENLLSELKAHHAAVGHHYSQSGWETMGYDYEAVRLDRHSPVERAITERYLHVPAQRVL